MVQVKLKRRHFIGGTLGAALVGCGGGDADPVTQPVPQKNIDLALAQLDGLTTELMASTGVPGVAVAVVHGDRTLYAKGFGVRDLRAAEPVDADTVFQLASVSKSLGATAVAHEVGAGHVRWDTPVQELLPWFELPDPQLSRLLTIGDLYAHRSGLPEHVGDHLEDLGFGQREVLERLRYVPRELVSKNFRKEYAYTNFGMTAAGVAVATKAKTDWATLNERVLYQPLGMHRTSSRFEDFVQRDNRVVGHRKVDGRWQIGPVRMPDAQAPAASVTSSVNDLARWLSMLLGQGSYQGRRIVDAAALAPALKVQPPGHGYGYGFNVGTTSGGRTLYSHSGAFGLGAATSFAALPTAGLGIVALTNAYPVGLPEVLRLQFVDLLEHAAIRQDYLTPLGRYFEDMGKPQGQLVGQSPPTSPRPPQPLSAYAGRYDNDFYGPLQIDQVGGGLQLTLGTMRLPLQHWDGDVFVFRPEAESATPGTISQATFVGGQVTLELYDDPAGIARFTR